MGYAQACANSTRPSIIILDSMGFGTSSRPTTIKNLREYLVAEATTKRGLEIKKDDIDATYAKVRASAPPKVVLIVDSRFPGPQSKQLVRLWIVFATLCGEVLRAASRVCECILGEGGRQTGQG